MKKKYKLGGDPSFLKTGNTIYDGLNSMSYFKAEDGTPVNITLSEFKSLPEFRRKEAIDYYYKQKGLTKISDANYKMLAAGGFSMESLVPVISAVNPVVGAVAGLALSVGRGIMEGDGKTPLELKRNIGVGNKYSTNYSKGGTTVPQFEAEEGEVALGNIRMRDSSHKSSMGSIVQGRKHEDGGTDGVGDGYILSDRYGVDGSYMKDNPNSIANKAKPYMKFLARHEKGDKVSPRAVSIVKDQLTKLQKLNESLLSLEEQDKMMAEGGSTSGFMPVMEDLTTSTMFYDNFKNPVNAMRTQMQPDPLVPMSTKQDLAVKTVDPIMSTSVGPKLEMPDIKQSNPESNANTATNDFAPKLTGMDWAGIGVQGLTAGLQLLNTVQAKKKTIEPINPYKNVSKRAEGTFIDSMNMLDINKSKALQDIDDDYAVGINAPMANSINVDRAQKAGMFASAIRAKSTTALQYDSAKATQKANLAQMQLQGDTMDAQGEGFVNESLRADLDNYFTNLGKNIQDISAVTQNVMKMWNESKSEAQVLNMLKGSFPDMTIEELGGMIQIIMRNNG